MIFSALEIQFMFFMNEFREDTYHGLFSCLPQCCIKKMENLYKTLYPLALNDVAPPYEELPMRIQGFGRFDFHLFYPRESLSRPAPALSRARGNGTTASPLMPCWSLAEIPLYFSGTAERLRLLQQWGLP